MFNLSPSRGKCTECNNYLITDSDPKKCSCAKMKGYVTMNALRKLMCSYYEPNPDLVEEL